MYSYTILICYHVHATMSTNRAPHPLVRILWFGIHWFQTNSPRVDWIQRSNFIGTRALLTGSSHHLDPCTRLGAPLAAHTRRRRCGLREDMPLFGGRPYWQPEKSHPSAVVASSPRTHGSKCRGAAPFEQSSNGPPVGENPQKHPRRKICRCTVR